MMKRAYQFIILTCVTSWAIAGVAILLGLSRENMLIFTVFGAAYMCLPAVCAVLLQLAHKEKPFRNANVSFRFNRWFVIAGIVPIFTAYLSLGISLLFPNVSFSASYKGFISTLPAEQAELAMRQLSRFPPAIFFFLQLGQVLVAGYTINALFAFGEEFGWRGFLLKALGNKKLLPVSLITGAVWGLWHFPLILLGHNYPQHPAAGVGMMVVWCILLSPVMTYITLKSKSVIAAAIFHGTLNAIAGIAILYLSGGNDLTNGTTGLAGFIALIFVNCAFFLFDKYMTKENIFTKAAREYFNRHVY
jgi:membrane protease YdiL (CAAX protease family)